MLALASSVASIRNRISVKRTPGVCPWLAHSQGGFESDGLVVAIAAQGGQSEKLWKISGRLNLADLHSFR
jgi:hypothetical protein